MAPFWTRWLAAAIGDVNLRIASLSGELDKTFEIPALEILATNLISQPEVLHSEASVRASNARIALARSERIPDVRVETLYHRLEATEENTIDLGISIPLPLFNRNHGRLREARAEAEAAQARARMTQSELTTRLQASYAQLTTALSNSRTFKDEVLHRTAKTNTQRHYIGSVATHSRMRRASAFQVRAELLSSSARISSLIDFRPLLSASIFGMALSSAGVNGTRLTVSVALATNSRNGFCPWDKCGCRRCNSRMKPKSCVLRERRPW